MLSAPRTHSGALRAALALALTLVASGCASAVRRTPRVVAPRPVARPVAETVQARTLVVPPLGSPRLLFREPGAASYYAVGGVRVQVRGQEAVVGEQPFASAIVGAGRVRGGHWVFVSHDGAVARADEFTGALHFVEALGAPVVRAFAWEGAMVAVFADGRARQVGVPGDGGGRGGVPESALSSPAAAPREAPEHEEGPAAQAALNGFPLARLGLPSTVILRTGDVAVQGTDHLYFASLARDGGLVSRGRVSLAGAVEGECTLHPWGARAILACSTQPDLRDPPVRAYAVDAEGVDALGAAGRGGLIVGGEGHTLTFRAACPGADAPATAESTQVTRACTYEVEREWREWVYPAQATVLDVHDTMALVSELRGESGIVGLRAYAIDLGRAMSVRLSDPAAELDRAGFTPDGRVVVLAHAGLGAARRSMVAVARLGDAMVLQPVGLYASDVAMADARHGLAVGPTAADVAETTDGGLTWSRVEVSLDGDPARVSLGAPGATDDDPPPAPTRAAGDAGVSAPRRPRPRAEHRVLRAGDWVQCSAVACRAGERLVHLWSEPVSVMPAME